MEGLMPLLIFLFLLKKAFCQSEISDNSGPIFIQEPPNNIVFSNTTEAIIICRARGVPQPNITWTKADGTPIQTVPGLRQVMDNVIILPPFRAADYRQDVHAQVYRCIAENEFGKIQSRDVHVRAVVSQSYTAETHNELGIIGNDVLFSCSIPSFVADLVSVVSWTNSGGKTYFSGTRNDGKYVVLPSGELLIRNVFPDDGFETYKCRTKHRLTGETRLSATAGRLVITEPIGGSPPKFSSVAIEQIVMASSSHLCLTCPAQGSPVPSFRWYKFMESNGNKKPVKLDYRVKQVGGTLIIKEAKVMDSGKYLCMVNNSVGGASVETVLTVTAPLTVEVEPKQQVIHYGGSATFKCNYDGNPIKAVFWLKDGVSIGHSEKILRIESVKKKDRGMYQCFIINNQESAQATAELKLGGWFDPPEFVKVFPERALEAGPSVQMPCVVKGVPTPEVKWFLYDKELADDLSTGVTISSFKAPNGDVTSYLNITQARINHGGLYKCVATSKLDSAVHSARLKIRGAPYVRPMDPLQVVAGKSMFVTCPVAGYPITTIVWERDGRQLPINDRQRVFNNGTVIIKDVQRNGDAATYTCIARNEEGYSARSDLEVTVVEPPSILPVTFGTEIMREGDFAQVVCIVTKGDDPLSITWSLNGDRVSSGFGISTTSLGTRTSMLSIASVGYRHTGSYTCTAANVAGVKSQTTQLKVNVPPRWTVEPTDKQFVQGSDAKVGCKADGLPKPQTSWKKAAGAKPENYQNLDMQLQSNIKVISGALVLKNIQKSSEGYYLCKASNGIGRGLSAVIYISVMDPPHFEIKTRSQTALKGESTVLQCEARGEKPMGIFWNMNNKRLDVNVDPRYTIKEEILSDGILSTISIKRSERKDSALFICVATNAFGSDDTSINLIIQEVPETPYGLKVLEKSGRNVKLSWQSPYNGNSNLTRYLIEYKHSKGTWQNDIDRVLVGGDETIAGVFSLRPATSFHFRIVAQNEIGSSGPSDIVTIETSDERPDGPPVDVRLAAVDQHTLRVNWKPPLTEHWNGAILGYYVGYKKTIKGDDKPYLFETVEFIKERGTENTLQISNLESFTEYAIVVQAFNKIGQGPMSEEVIEHTAEGAPSKAPEEVKVTVLSSQTIRLSWSSPPLSSANGIIKGYKIVYGPSKTWYDDSIHDTKIATETESDIHGLKKYTNYSMQVLAYTNGGDGVRTAVFTAMTDQDLPGAPSSVKALAMSEDSILISWQHPLEPNGKILQYTVYVKELDRSRDNAPSSYKVSAVQMNYHSTGLNRKSRYEFWVTAHTTIGEGAPSTKATLSPSSRVPAKIASFDETFVVAAKMDVKMPCIAVGNPSPDITWKIKEKPFVKSDRIRMLPDGSIQVNNVTKDDAGVYECFVNNKFGQDMITHTLTVNGPPNPPTVILTGQTTDTISFKLKNDEADNTPIHGYTVHYKQKFGDWSEEEIGFGTEEYTLQHLWCGQRYQFFVTARNSIGVGKPSLSVKTRTKGVEPTVPDARDFLEVSAGSVTLHLNAWLDGGCAMIYFVVEYKLKDQRDWTLISNTVKPGGNFVVLDLNPATWYKLKVTAHNNAGFSIAEYEFATLTKTGGILSEGR